MEANLRSQTELHINSIGYSRLGKVVGPVLGPKGHLCSVGESHAMHRAPCVDGNATIFRKFHSK